MSRLSPIFEKLKATRAEDDNGFLKEVTYADISRALIGAKISDIDILQDFRTVVITDIAAAVHAYAENEGPHSQGTLEAKDALDLVNLYNAILEAAERLSRLQEGAPVLEPPPLEEKDAPADPDLMPDHPDPYR